LTRRSIRPVILQACLNGPRHPVDVREGVELPVTPSALATAAVAAVDAGADGVHLHPKDASGSDTLDPVAVGAAVAAVRRALPDAQVGVTTGAWAMPDPAGRARLVAAWRDLGELPDVASVNWHEEGAPELAALLLGSGIGVEAGLWTPSAARAFSAWPRVGEVARVLVESTLDDARAAPSDAASILAELRTPHPRTAVLVHGEGAGAWPVLGWAAGRGYAVRIGLEDVLTLPDGAPATSNAELVVAARAVIARA
jgi:uncharacterized protein (DUF849 family)